MDKVDIYLRDLVEALEELEKVPAEQWALWNKHTESYSRAAALIEQASPLMFSTIINARKAMKDVIDAQ